MSLEAVQTELESEARRVEAAFRAAFGEWVDAKAADTQSRLTEPLLAESRLFLQTLGDVLRDVQRVRRELSAD